LTCSSPLLGRAENCTTNPPCESRSWRRCCRSSALFERAAAAGLRR
jgi:hypothetical protein